MVWHEVLQFQTFSIHANVDSTVKVILLLRNVSGLVCNEFPVTGINDIFVMAFLAVGLIKLPAVLSSTRIGNCLGNKASRNGVDYSQNCRA